MTNKPPIRVAVYGKGLPKVRFAFTGEPPIYIFSLQRRQYDTTRNDIFVYDWKYSNSMGSIDKILFDFTEFIENFKQYVKSGTIIIDRMTDLIHFIDYKEKERSQVFLPRTSSIIKDIITQLISTNLDIVMLFGEKEIWVKDKPSGYYDPDWIEEIKYMIHFKIHALPNEYRQVNRLAYAYRIMDEPTISYLKSIQPGD